MNELLTLMDKVKTSGTFSVGGTLPSIPPGLKVKGVGHVALPLLEQQAKALIEFSQQSPFGMEKKQFTTKTFVSPGKLRRNILN